MREALLAVLLITVSFAGCLGTDDDTDPDTDPDTPGNVSAVWAEKAVPFEEGHDHADRSQHTGLSTPNFQVLGYDPMATEYHGGTSGGYLCGDVATEGERDIAISHSFSTDVAFVVLDVTDPSQPRTIGELVLPYSHTYDAAVTPDGKYVALAISEVSPDTGPDDQQIPPTGPAVTSTAAQDGSTTLTMEYTTACGTTTVAHEQVPYKNGVVLVDISDPEEPSIADYLPQPVFGPHSIFATSIDGTYQVLASTTNLAHSTSYFTFLTIEETPLGARLVEEHEYSAQYPGQSFQGDQPALTNGHVDGWIAKHPVDDTTYAYLANWNGGMHVLARDGPADTWQRVAVWNDYDASAGAGMTGSIHGTYPVSTTWEVSGALCEAVEAEASNGSSCERHYTFAGQEVVGRPAERPTGQIVMLDTTDPADPQAVARWTMPTDTEFEGSLLFSTHYVTVVDRTLFVSTYHGGVWAAGTEPIEGTHELPTKGVFIPDRAPPTPPNPDYISFDWTPIVLDVLALPSGDLVVFDGTSGAYTVGFDDAMPVPQPEPWTEDGWTPPDATTQDPVAGLAGS